MKGNHVIDWDSAKIVELERDDQGRGVKARGSIHKDSA